MYKTHKGSLKKIDAIGRTLIFMDGARIDIPDILRLTSDVFNGLPDDASGV